MRRSQLPIVASAILVLGGAAAVAVAFERPTAEAPASASSPLGAPLLQPPSKGLRARAESAYARLPLAFAPAREEGAFLARSGGASVLVQPRQALFALRRPQAKRPAFLRLELADARERARLLPSRRLPGIVNEFLGDDPVRWRTNLPTFARLLVPRVYRGIDVAYHGRRGSLQYDFLLAPGADPWAIALRFSGQKSLRLDPAGDLLLGLPGGTLRQTRPRAFQDGRQVAARFLLRDGLVRFQLGRYDRSRPLLIDPSVPYSSYLGGGGSDVGQGIAVDASGSAYLTGYTDSSNFPTASPFQAANAGGLDAFVSKLNAAGSALAYSSYLGGGGTDAGRGIAVDSSGSAYLTGQTTSTNFPTASPFQLANAGGSDAFVTKLNAAGSALAYSSYLGGSGEDVGQGIAVDSSGSAYLTGYTLSINFPTQNPFQAANGGGRDAFVSKLNAAGSALAYSSYLGGGGFDDGRGIAVDASGSAYLTGQTESTNFPTTSPFQAANAGGLDAFVTKVGPATPTGVSVRSFTATRSGRSVLLRWRTASGSALLGFHLYREARSGLVRLNARLIPATPAARSHAFRDRPPAGTGAARYWLEAVRLDGTSVRYGPVRPS